MAQKYTFTHYDIENGLIQSQVNKFYQDSSHRLWMATLGGACRFDGNEYYAVSKATGLLNNFVYAVFCDSRGRVWFGTNRGLANMQGHKLHNFATPAGFKNGWVTRIAEDRNGTIWLVIDNRLCKISGNHIVSVDLPGQPNSIGAIAIDADGKLCVFKYHAGIFKLNVHTWQRIISLPQSLADLYVSKIIFDKKEKGKTYLLAFRGVFVAHNDTVMPYAADILDKARRPFLSMDFDAAHNLWIGTTSGAYCVKKQQLFHFGAGNGFTDNSVSDIYRDRDNNLWLGTQGSGVYRYEGDDYVVYNTDEAIKNNPIVMGIALGRDNKVLLGTDGGGLVGFDGKDLKVLWADSMPYSRKIESLYKDHAGIVWIGTSLGGLWNYDGKKATLFKGTENNSVNAITEDDDHVLWMASALGLYYYQHNVINRVEGVNVFVSNLVNLGKDSILIGTQEGAALVVNKKKVPGFKVKQLGNTAILCMLKYKRLIMFGTDDSGLFIWNRQSGQVKNYQVKDGLKANSIYSLAVDSNGLFWAGTGRGVSRFSFSPGRMRIGIINGSQSREQITESNQNAILLYHGKMLVGTTKGLAVYNTDIPVRTTAAPHIIINSVKLFQQGSTKTRLINREDLRKELKLPYNQNHLSISFLGVYLKNPEGVSYQYRLTGLDDKFCLPVKNDVVDYPSLPPGRYVFEVRAVSADGLTSKNTASFSFEITPPFYRTYVFELAVVLLFIFLVVFLQNYFHRRKVQRQLLLERMKREEKLKIRQQTAEDFHDDLGNKLTRITVLSDILDAKLEKDETEQKNLVLQIKQNAAALYNGTRDILWAMDPKSDNLYEVLTHIKEIGIELFQDVPVKFEFGKIDTGLTAVKLPMEYSRNITMIFKEMLTNVLKHAGAHQVSFTWQAIKNEVTLCMADDGAGFDTGTFARGHGLNNVKARARRIGAGLHISSAKGSGTTVRLIFNISKNIS